jgi:uncharacterized membrane protein
VDKVTFIIKNYKTATKLLAVVALAAVLVAAGTIAAAPGSDYFAFAKKKRSENSGIAVPTITAQKQKCETAYEEQRIV